MTPHRHYAALSVERRPRTYPTGGPRMPLFGVDVSNFQGQPDYGKVKAAGVTFVIAKATEGTGYTDPSYARNRAAIPAAGLIPGAYHFLRGTHPGADQADAFVKVADPNAVHALDVECLDDVRQFNRHLDVPGFVQRYRQHLPTHPLVIYTGRDFWTACAGTAVPGPTYGPLWAAGAAANTYVTGTGSLAQQWAKAGAATSSLPWGGWNTWATCQFTDAAIVPGINGGVDGDVFTGTLDQLKALTGATTPEVDVPLTPAEIEAIGAAAGRHVHSQQIYRATWVGADGTPQPLLFADALLAAARKTFPSADQVAAAVKAALGAIPVTGTATLSDADVARIAGKVADELATRLVK